MNCCFLFHNVVLQDGVNDCWKWLLDPIKGFSVSDNAIGFVDNHHHGAWLILFDVDK